MNDTSRHDKPALPADAVKAAAEVRLRQYGSEYSASHLTWRDFADEAREMLEAAAPAIRDQATTAERERWSARFRDLAATYLPNIMTAEGAQALARTDPNSPSQVRGRLLLDLADVLDGGTQ